MACIIFRYIVTAIRSIPVIVIVYETLLLAKDANALLLSPLH